MKHMLISVIPSEDTSLKIREIRTGIFKTFGLISARCLPEMIPVAFVNNIPDKKSFKGLTITGTASTSSCCITQNGDLYLPLENEHFLEGLSSRISPADSGGFIRMETGFYLCTLVKGSSRDEVLNFVNETLERVKWVKNTLALIQIETFKDIWWEDLRWETVWEEKLRTKNNGHISS